MLVVDSIEDDRVEGDDAELELIDSLPELLVVDSIEDDRVGGDDVEDDAAVETGCEVKFELGLGLVELEYVPGVVEGGLEMLVVDSGGL
ncbi:MAG: hypothetical protein Q9165_006394 [Trypethelium subeluteriae]